MPDDDVGTLLTAQFPTQHTTAALKHHREAVNKYQAGDWEGSLLKGGKFVEAVMKALLTHGGLSVPPSRRFKVGGAVRSLGQLSSNVDEVVRLLIPRACMFIYDIVSNRGTRHDPDQIDPNKMDASVVISVISWILAEMVRFAAQNTANTVEAVEIVEGLTEKKSPYFEEIEGRTYVNLGGLTPRELALLLLYVRYPRRISRRDLSAAIKRHGIRGSKVDVALTRLKDIVDDDDGEWRIRQIGREEAERILSRRAL